MGSSSRPPLQKDFCFEHRKSKASWPCLIAYVSAYLMHLTHSVFASTPVFGTTKTCSGSHASLLWLRECATLLYQQKCWLVAVQSWISDWLCECVTNVFCVCVSAGTAWGPDDDDGDGRMTPPVGKNRPTVGTLQLYHTTPPSSVST